MGALEPMPTVPLSRITLATAKRRNYAHPFDRPVHVPDAERAVHGVGRSPDAIGGYYGIGWYQHYKDRETKEIYSVHCTDGVYGGHGPFSLAHMQWMETERQALWQRAKAGDLRFSTNEFALLRHFMKIPGVPEPQEDPALPDRFTTELP